LVDITFPLDCDDDTLSKDSNVYQWSLLSAKAGEMLNRPLDSAKRYAQQLTEAGFTNVVEKRYKWPQNRWPKDPKYKELG
jgi:hypothetical protein